VGRAVAAVPAAGVNNRIGGMALYSGIVGDLLDHVVNTSQLQG
jgi:hypothetical protein